MFKPFFRLFFTRTAITGTVAGIIILTLISMQMQGDKLTYLVRDCKPGTHDPVLIIMLHGYGSNAEDLFGLAPEFPSNMVVVSLKAPLTLSPGSYAWYHLDRSTGIARYDIAEVEKAKQQLHAAVKELKDKYKPASTYLFGFSQGAIMSYSIAFEKPESITGIIALSGRMLVETTRSAVKAHANNLRIFIGHGNQDQVMPVSNAIDATRYLQEHNLKYTFKEYPITHTISAQEMKDVLEWLK